VPNVSKAPRAGHYDVIVIGAGFGGVSTAAYLARHGVRVLVIERLDGPGGYAHEFRRGPYVFDPTIHILAQAGEGETIDRLLRYLGVRERCSFVRLPHLYRLELGGTRIDVPEQLQPFIDAHCRAFPGDADGVRGFFALCDRFFSEATRVPLRLSIRDLGPAVEDFPTFFAYRTATLGAVLAEHIRDPRCRAACAAIWPLLGLPPARLSFEIFARFMISIISGLYHCVGGFQRLAEAFVAALEAQGGEIVFDASVERILIERGRVKGVVLADGSVLESPIVISNADARRTFNELVGRDLLPPPLVRKIDRLRPSISSFVVYAVAAGDLARSGAAHQTFVYDGPDHEGAYDRMSAGRWGFGQLVVPSLHDDALAPAGEQVLTVTSLAGYDIGAPWPEVKPRLQEEILGRLEPLLPGLRERIVFVQSATPETMERYTLNSRGASYGWENSPDQSASKRLPYETPFEGLYLSGHWTQAGSALRVIVSGVQVGQLVLAATGAEDVGPRF
jgi:phytoene dehydrogenase-like protein